MLPGYDDDLFERRSTLKVAHSRGIVLEFPIKCAASTVQTHPEDFPVDMRAVRRGRRNDASRELAKLPFRTCGT